MSCVQLLLVVERTGFWIEEVGRGRRKLSNEEIDDLYVGKDDEVAESQVDGSVTHWSEKELTLFCVIESSETLAASEDRLKCGDDIKMDLKEQ